MDQLLILIVLIFLGITIACIYKTFFLVSKGMDEIIKGLNCLEERLSRIEKKIDDGKE